eukprot:TRINITY_DN3933_c0_g1_i2.p1 TRINITY_DN3933_c0_g1~~TRINITY_DN3933_c0_g1_i2.p1  ORF type:complete len:238 (-),score=12.57 TRINITY_DN3933_c0_g1_i2:37-750(-)
MLASVARKLPKSSCVKTFKRHILVPLIPRDKSNNNKDVTLYIKGFFARNKEPEHFEGWKHSHEKLVLRKSWGTCAYGWHWDSGTITDIPVPWTTLAGISWSSFKMTSRLFRLSPMGLASMAVIDVGFYLAMRYWQATQNAETFAAQLAKAIGELQQESSGGKLRLVAHSLGCKLLIHALTMLPQNLLPHEVYLCGPAIIESEVQELIAMLSKEQTFVYYSEFYQLSVTYLHLLLTSK